MLRERHPSNGRVPRPLPGRMAVPHGTATTRQRARAERQAKKIDACSSRTGRATCAVRRLLPATTVKAWWCLLLVWCCSSAGAQSPGPTLSPLSGSLPNAGQTNIIAASPPPAPISPPLPGIPAAPGAPAAPDVPPIPPPPSPLPSPPPPAPPPPPPPAPVLSPPVPRVIAQSGPPAPLVTAESGPPQQQQCGGAMQGSSSHPTRCPPPPSPPPLRGPPPPYSPAARPRMRPAALAGIAIGAALGGCAIVLCASGIQAEFKRQRQMRDARREQARHQYHVVTVLDP